MENVKTPITDSKALLFEMGFPVLNCTEVVDANQMRKLEIDFAKLRVLVKDDGTLCQEAREILNRYNEEGKQQ